MTNIMTTLAEATGLSEYGLQVIVAVLWFVLNTVGAFFLAQIVRRLEKISEKLQVLELRFARFDSVAESVEDHESRLRHLETHAKSRGG